MTDDDPIAPEHIAHVIALLERAVGIAQDGLARRRALGETDPAASSAATAVDVLSGTLRGVRNGTFGPSVQNLGLSRGAADRAWLPEETPLTELFSEIDHYWYWHVWEPGPDDRRVTFDELPIITSW